MYPNVKYLTETEFQKMKDLDAKETFSKAYKMPPRQKKNYYSNSRKKIQRTLNYCVRNANNLIKNDYLWRGRFFIRQVGFAPYVRFEDGSGGELYVTLRIYDKKADKYIDKFESAGSLCFFGGAKIFEFMNDAIVKHFDVWRSEDDPRDDRIIYTSIPDEYTVKNATPLKKFNYI